MGFGKRVVERPCEWLSFESADPLVWPLPSFTSGDWLPALRKTKEPFSCGLDGLSFNVRGDQSRECYVGGHMKPRVGPTFVAVHIVWSCFKVTTDAAVWRSKLVSYIVVRLAQLQAPSNDVRSILGQRFVSECMPALVRVWPSFASG